MRFHSTSIPAWGNCLFSLPKFQRADAVSLWHMWFKRNAVSNSQWIKQKKNNKICRLMTFRTHNTHQVDLCLLRACECYSLARVPLLWNMFPSANSFDWMSVFICRQQTPSEKQFNNWIAACGKSALWLDVWIIYILTAACVCVCTRRTMCVSHVEWMP